MYELIKVSDESYYIQSPAKIGVIKTGENEVCLIDSGNDKDAGKKVKKIIDSQGWKLKAIFNTHSHADHIGGNKYLQNQTGCKIYAPEIESDFIKHTILEPSFLYGGNPPKNLRHKFLMAQESEVLPLTEKILPSCLEMISLKGHSFDMAGFRTADDVVYIADCLSSEETLKKYQINFLVDVENYLNTLEAVKKMSAKLFIPSHAQATENIEALAQLNIDKVHEISNKILDICQVPITFENLLKKLFDFYGLNLTFEQYALVGSTVKSYLTWLNEKESIKIEIENNIMFWRS